MRRVLGVSVLVVLLLVLGVSNALAEGFTVGGKVLYGNVGIRLDESSRCGSTFALYSFDAGWRVTDNIALNCVWTSGDSGVRSKDSAFSYNGQKSYSPYQYSDIKLDATVKVTDHVSFLTGVTRYAASRAAMWDDWRYEAWGYGYKLGAMASLPLSDKLSASVKYAYLPYIYMEEKDEPDTSPDYSCVGPGFEFELAASYAISDSFKLNGGLRTDFYGPRNDCCGEQEDVSLNALYLGVTYSF